MDAWREREIFRLPHKTFPMIVSVKVQVKREMLRSCSGNFGCL